MQYQDKIVTALEKVTGIEAKKLTKCMEKCKIQKEGDISILVIKMEREGMKMGKEELMEKLKNEVGDMMEMKYKNNYINIKINKDEIINENVKVLNEIINKGEEYGKNEIGKNKKIIIEYSSPNIAKPFHIGHLRSTIIGNYVKKIHEYTGHEVISINYLGDWGKQYGLLALGYNLFGNKKELETDAIKHLFNLYVEINKMAKEDDSINEQAREYFKKMEEGNEEVLSMWNSFKELSMKEYKKIYDRLHVNFDVFSGESLTIPYLPSVIDKLNEKQLLCKSNDATVVDLSSYNLGKALIKKSNGTTLYLTRDIAEACNRYEKYKFDKMYYVVGDQQDFHFKQLFTILSLMDYDWASCCHHIPFGMVQGMSTRQGTVVFLDEILDKTQLLIKEVMISKNFSLTSMDQISRELALSSIIIQDLSSKRLLGYKFSWDRMTSLDGYSGAYLQYTHARLFSLYSKSNITLNIHADLTLLIESQAILLIQHLSLFPNIILSTLNNLEPFLLVSYLFELAHFISSALHVLQVKGSLVPLAESRLLLFHSSRIVLSNGLSLLGLIPLECM